MYCSHCGSQIPDDSAFCPKCGQKPGKAGQPAVQSPQAASPSYQQQAQPVFVKSTKSRLEFSEEYYRDHQYYQWKKTKRSTSICATLLLILPWLAILIFQEDLDMSQSEFTNLVIVCYVLAVIVYILCGVAISKMKKIETEAEKAYRNYEQNLERGQTSGRSGPIFSDSGRSNRSRSSAPVNSTYGWKCSACGRVNADYVGTCACGKRKP